MFFLAGDDAAAMRAAAKEQGARVLPVDGPWRESAHAERSGARRAARAHCRVPRSRGSFSSGSTRGRCPSSTARRPSPRSRRCSRSMAALSPRRHRARVRSLEPRRPSLSRLRRDVHRRAPPPWWARLQHLWLGERIAHLAALAALGDNDARRRRGASPPRRVRHPLPRLSQPGQRARARRGSSSPPISSRSGSPASSRRRCCSARPASSTRPPPTRSTSSRTRPPT